MAARKLQAEIDRTFKKVQEGIAAFDDIQYKLDASSNQSQKEKLEADLKKEIKRLQRLRDQIKTWASSSDIKDKKPLLENRRLIETKMEEFKVVEKEMKTKAFSKEGLSAAAKLDPKEKEKTEVGQWISSMIEELDRQIEQFEAEQDSLQSSVKKRSKDTAKQDRLQEIEHFIDRHKWHQGRLEKILRLVENDSLSPSQVEKIKEDIAYYVESNQDADFAEDDDIYEDLNLDSDEIAPEPESEDEPPNDDLIYNLNSDRDRETEEDGNRDKKDDKSTGPSPDKQPAVKKDKDTTAAARIPTAPAAPAAVTSRKPGGANNTASAVKPGSRESPVSQINGLQKLAPLPPAPRTKPEMLQYATAVAGSAAAAAAAAAATTTSASSVSPAASLKTEMEPRSPATTNATAVKSAAAADTSAREDDPSQANLTTPAAAAASEFDGVPSLDTNKLLPGIQDLVSSFQSARSKYLGLRSPAETGALLSSSFHHVTDAADSEMQLPYRPQNPAPVPSYYPQQPLRSLESPYAVDKMDPDTLFFMFYYQPGSYQQSLAARELKKQSWRFHKKYLTWFQRHEEPKLITDEFESGTYRYFDFEGSWIQRKKPEFKFMYSYLEDED